MAGAKAEGCVLCEAAQAEDDEQHLVLYRGQHNFVILNRFPYNSGHLMVTPYQHLSDFARLSSEALAEMMDISQGVIEALNQCLHPEGVNLGMNLGSAAGAGIDDHIHLHIIPRWTGDTNFITALGEVRVVPQALEATAGVIGPVLREIMQRRKT